MKSFILLYQAGYFDRARTKFSHCMEKVPYEHFDDWVLVSIPPESSHLDSLKSLDSPGRSSVKRQIGQMGKTRPPKDPPLLIEIMQILENQSQLNPDYFSMQSRTSGLNSGNSGKKITLQACFFFSAVK